MGKSVWPLMMINPVDDLSARAEKRSAKIITDIRASNGCQARLICLFLSTTKKRGRTGSFSFTEKREKLFQLIHVRAAAIFANLERFGEANVAGLVLSVEVRKFC